MDAAWITPPVVLASGAAAVAVLARKLAAATEELRGAGRRFRRVEDAMIPIRVESRTTRAAVERMRRQ